VHCTVNSEWTSRDKISIWSTRSSTKPKANMNSGNLKSITSIYASSGATTSPTTSSMKKSVKRNGSELRNSTSSFNSTRKKGSPPGLTKCSRKDSLRNGGKWPSRTNWGIWILRKI
jgi:hypothetical protein